MKDLSKYAIPLMGNDHHGACMDFTQWTHLHVAVFQYPNLVYTYLHNEKLDEGTLVQVPFGHGVSVGVVTSESEKIAYLPELEDLSKLKKIHRVIDEIPVYSRPLIHLAKFLSTYYLHPLGDVFKTLQSYGARSHQNWRFVLNPTCPTHDHKDLVKQIFGSRLLLRKPTFLKNFDKCTEELKNQEKKDLLRRLLNDKVILRQFVPGGTGKTQKPAPAPTREIVSDAASRLLKLNTTQKNALANLTKNLGHYGKPHLLHGITGSGKTQVYLHLIHQLLMQNPSAQVLVMVPEISLTPQMKRVFTHPFGELVSVVHSAMDPGQRMAELESLRSLKKQILIGPRSSLFAPFCHLKLIIIDEEHDSSYKQGTGLLYHGRDAAIIRAKLEDATIVLGSATPSLESYHNTITGKYLLSSLHVRATARNLPYCQIIEELPSTQKAQPINPYLWEQPDPKSPVSSVSAKIIAALKDNLQKGFQAMVIVQRRGYAQFVLDRKSRETIQCPKCRVSLTLHRRGKKLLCHICDYSEPLHGLTKSYPDAALVAVGQGSEKVFDHLRHELPTARLARLDSDIPRIRARMPEILEDFRQQKIDILVGTQMLAKGHDFPSVTLVALVELDQILRLPDFRAGEKAFQLIVQASGRSGRAEHQGWVLMQSSRPDHPVIQDGLKQDYLEFYQKESAFRKLFNYPPFSRMIHLEYYHKDENIVDKVSADFQRFILSGGQYPRSVRVLGPSRPGVDLIGGEYRRTITLFSQDLSSLHHFALQLRRWFDHKQESVRFKVDVDPQSVF